MQTPIILFSLPRSGSTLLQRILSVSPEISTVAEPWVLLPLVYALKREGVYAEYSHRLAWQATQDLLDGLPGGRQDYLEAMGVAGRALYAKLSHDDARYFLDKTPRYALIADDVMQMFSDGKFIYLWRDPLALIASMIETWGQGRWNLYIYKVDLYDGMARLVDTYREHSESALAVNYEALLNSPEQELGRVLAYLELPFDRALLETFPGVDFAGKMGDPSGVKDYQALSAQPLDKWKKTLNNPLRKLWCRRYLAWLGRDRLAVMGYDLDALLAELKTADTRWGTIPGDILRFGVGLVYSLFDIRIIRRKLACLSDWKRLKHYS